ncbi:MAG: glycosyltransferase [Candidatus Bathyarchaeia archaeon]
MLLKEERNMKIDVIVCTKNSEKTLKNCLQLIRKFIQINRLIIIDGVEIAKKFNAEIYYDGGVSLGLARNLGLNLAETEIVAFIDSDAYITKEWFPKLIKYFDDPKVALVSNLTIYGCNVAPIKRLYEYMYLKKRMNFIGFISTLVRRKTVIEMGGIKDLPSCEDQELFERVIKNGYKWISDNTVITYHPQGLINHLKHYYWWGKGYRRKWKIWRPLKMFITSPAVGLKLALVCHPIHLIYYPLLRFTFLYGYVKERNCCVT